jgi:hypothetical protein
MPVSSCLTMQSRMRDYCITTFSRCIVCPAAASYVRDVQKTERLPLSEVKVQTAGNPLTFNGEYDINNT